MKLPSYSENPRGYRAIFGGFLIHMMIGTFYLWGNINIYVTSYMRYKKSDVTTDLLNSTFPFMALTMSGFTFFSLGLAEKIGIQRANILCTILFSLCSLLGSFQTTYLPFALIYGLGSGVASGLIYMIPYYVSYCHFPDHKGTASGIISAGFGVSTFIFSWIVYLVANPSNIHTVLNETTGETYFPDEVSARVPALFQILSLIFLCMGGLGSYLCVPPPQNELHDKPIGYKSQLDEEKNAEKVVEIQDENVCRDLKTGLKTYFIYLTVILLALYGSQGNLTIDNFKPIGSQLGSFSDAYLTTVSSVGSLFNGFVRIIWGRALDRYPFKKLAYLNLGIELVLMLTFYYSCKSRFSFILWVLSILSCFGGWSAMVPALLAKIYGNVVGSTLYGVTVQGQTIACWVQFFIVDYLRASYGWFFIFMIYSIIICIALILTKFIKFEINWKEFYLKENQKNKISEVNPSQN